MTKIINLPRISGPLVTAALILGYHAGAHYFGYSVTLVWLALAVVAGSFAGGLRAGLVAALLAAGYAFYALPADAGRAWQVTAGMVAIAGVVGYLRRRERSLQQAMIAAFSNGNVAKIRYALAIATAAKDEIEDQKAKLRFEYIESALGNTLAILDGYRYLRDEIERVNLWYANPKNAAKLKQMEMDK